MKNNFKAVTTEIETISEATVIIKSEAVDLALKDIGQVRAKLEAYNKVYAHFSKFITYQAERLAEKKFAAEANREVAVARLVLQWLIETEHFLTEMEPVLQGAAQDVRKGFIEESLSGLDSDIRDELMGRLEDKKFEMLEWFTKELQKAKKRMSGRK